jgi:putative phosphoribosyl transferase
MSEQSGERRTGAVTSVEDPQVFVSGDARFRDRHEAGRQLAARLVGLRGEHPIVVAIPRGGVPVASEVANALDAPHNPEFAIGALAEGGVHVLSNRAVRALGFTRGELEAILERAEHELAERLRSYRGTREPLDVTGRTVILVDDGLATGRSALAAVRSLRQRGAARIVLAVPVAAPESADALRADADEVVCVETPEDLWAVGLWYEDFRPTTDQEVAELLAEHARKDPAQPAADASAQPAADAQAGEARIPLAGAISLQGDLSVPPSARGIVAFAHGSGSSRRSPRNRAVAGALNDAGFATLLFDLLTPAEEGDRANVFDISLLARRLLAASAWLREQDDLAGLPLGYFGASTGAAAALTAAAELGDRVRAVVSRGGRPDLARDLGAVHAPTLLIVGGADLQVLELNRAAREQLRCTSELAVVEGATHLFEEPGALEQVARLAIGWLRLHLAAAGDAEPRGSAS